MLKHLEEILESHIRIINVDVQFNRESQKIFDKSIRNTYPLISAQTLRNGSIIVYALPTGKKITVYIID